MHTATIQRFLKEDEGATAIEYGLIAGLISLVIIVALTTLGTNLSDLFTSISNKVSAATAKTDAGGDGTEAGGTTD